jgi:hypothetical protein
LHCLSQRSPLDDNIERGTSQVSIRLNLDPVQIRMAPDNLGNRFRKAGFAGNSAGPAGLTRDNQRGNEPMISAVSNLMCIEWTRLIRRLGPNIRRFAAVRGAPLSVTVPLEAEHSCQDFSMQNYIESQNIANFKERLGMETDPVKQEILRQLLADEMAKYAARVEASAHRRP